MPNTLATPTWVTKEVARGFINSIKFVANCNRTYDDAYMQAGAKVGYTVNARLPQRFQVNDGQALTLQSLYDQTVPISLTNQKNVAFGYSSAQATMEIQNVRERYVQPAAEALANAADVLAYQAVYRDIYSSVGVPGTTPATNLLYLQAGVLLSDLATPMEGRVAVLDPMAMVTLSNANVAIFNPASLISEMTRTGQFGRDALGIGKWFQDQNRPSHTSGTFTASTPLVNTAGQTGATLITDGWANGAAYLKKGDLFTVGGVYSVNPLSYQSTGRLQQFVVTADIDSTATTTNMTIGISPSIIISGQLQTVSNAPADNAVITVVGATSAAGGTLATTQSPQSLVFHPDAFAFVMADLIKPGAGAQSTTVRSKEWGIAIRMVEQYQIGTDQNPARLDILIGAATIQARLAARVQG
jgi:hypothetical protein